MEAKTAIIAGGAHHRYLNVPGEKELTGSGVSYCAVCDGDFFTGQSVCIAGGGNSALQDALLLSGKCKSVTILQDLPFLTGEEALQTRIKARDNITCLLSVKLTALEEHENQLTAVHILQNNEERVIACNGLFVAIGLIPENEAFTSMVDLNEAGYFDTDETCITKTPGLFTAGDCRRKSVRQLTTAIGDGACSAMAACRFLDRLSV